MYYNLGSPAKSCEQLATAEQNIGHSWSKSWRHFLMILSPSHFFLYKLWLFISEWTCNQMEKQSKWEMKHWADCFLQALGSKPFIVFVISHVIWSVQYTIAINYHCSQFAWHFPIFSQDHWQWAESVLGGMHLEFVALTTVIFAVFTLMADRCCRLPRQHSFAMVSLVLSFLYIYFRFVLFWFLSVFMF